MVDRYATSAENKQMIIDRDIARECPACGATKHLAGKCSLWWNLPGVYNDVMIGMSLGLALNLYYARDST